MQAMKRVPRYGGLMCLTPCRAAQPLPRRGIRWLRLLAVVLLAVLATVGGMS